jgi:hypothetical protein
MGAKLSILPVFKKVSAYTGPGDIASGAAAWWGLRGYSAAYSTGSNPAVDLVDQAGNNPITINILSNGNLDVGSINAWVTAHSVTTITVKKLYDQTGNANHVSQTVLSQMPTLVLNVLGALPAIFYFSSSAQVLTGSTLPVAAYPIWCSYVAERTGNTIANNQVINTNAGGAFAQFGFRQNVTSVYEYAGAIPLASASDNAFHAVQNYISGAGASNLDSIYVDGVNTGGLNAGTSVPTGSVVVGDTAMNGYILEAGLWGSDQTSKNSAMNSNQHTYWGF